MASIHSELSLDKHAIGRYSRQLILPEIGTKGQKSIMNSSVLIVGAGGLGCPATLYLAAAGIGKLGIIDYDEVELSNLHRQVLHKETNLNVKKAESASTYAMELNSGCQCIPYHVQLDSTNAMDIIKNYDIVLDCTDNAATRYLLNDACVLSKKPLVSGSALRFEGQLTVYNHEGGPCYRCLYPKPPPPEAVTNCSDGGVLGPTSFSQKLFMFDGLNGTFRTICLRGRQKSCVVCGDDPSVTELIDYEQFCGASATDKCQKLNLLDKTDHVTVEHLLSVSTTNTPSVYIDVRPQVEFDICHLKNFQNIPLNKIASEEHIALLNQQITSLCANEEKGQLTVYILCKQGNDSQKAVLKLKEKLDSTIVKIKNIQGGLAAWSNRIDPNFPTY
ncbi:adenylyltransferase and sulfurtransferase MOCS3-like [Anneissia japonica]|uniref:adenylyltransferase and sulfurtransferase MOCS3-like n=1 Tax=Anneissia japonica TaxID=1529436 RepID=UPI0014256A19|nr:adenylyltransferase and sulfurtransferase MOCS3-like [Anneissia japonica]XP_033095359.1 adenylyltransferase and sulfurtransferase MOCS3-like [Anneissia japonica]XP_033095360.1 adenylyltransferase and sulfurtransferase MOCS3-like [Anneissia japonica]XP_033095361.1 adenylyltransferase and sulfurtransferase MOCS3-like [Anneissia japonica]XP_033095362.1 adenylyltransferase and sulfurtransferase MOCS3-like [Anneissia japonica]XP_033095363.1 adenylyltransferase and sulfurtransferase MOCS3-like [A